MLGLLFVVLFCFICFFFCVEMLFVGLFMMGGGIFNWNAFASDVSAFLDVLVFDIGIFFMELV